MASTLSHDHQQTFYALKCLPTNIKPKQLEHKICLIAICLVLKIELCNGTYQFADEEMNARSFDKDPQMCLRFPVHM